MKIAKAGTYKALEDFTVTVKKHNSVTAKASSGSGYTYSMKKGAVFTMNERDIDLDNETVESPIGPLSWELPVTRVVAENETPLYLVSLFNKKMGRKSHNYLEAPLDELESQLDMIQSEVDELRLGLKGLEEEPRTYDAINEVRDAIADILVTTYGMAYLLRVDADEDVRAVMASNDTKFLSSLVDACDTVDEMATLGVSTYISQPEGVGQSEIYAVRTQNMTQTGTDGVVWQPNKLVKPASYRLPELRHPVLGQAFYEDNNLLCDYKLKNRE